MKRNGTLVCLVLLCGVQLCAMDVEVSVRDAKTALAQTMAIIAQRVPCPWDDRIRYRVARAIEYWILPWLEEQCGTSEGEKAIQWFHESIPYLEPGDNIASLFALLRDPEAGISKSTYAEA